MLEQLKKMLEEGKSEEEIRSYLQGLFLTPEGVKGFLESVDGKKILQPLLDAHFTKGLDTWKEKTMPKLIEDEIKKRFPDETEENKKLRQLEERLEASEKARVKSELTAKATTLATQKGLPIELVANFVGHDEETTTSNLAALEAAWQKSIEAAVETRFKDNGRDPHNKSKNEDTKKNPWKKEHFNLTEQGRILKENPDLAKKLKQAAN